MIYSVFVIDFINFHNLQRETILQNQYVNVDQVILIENFIYLAIFKLKVNMIVRYSPQTLNSFQEDHNNFQMCF